MEAGYIELLVQLGQQLVAGYKLSDSDFDSDLQMVKDQP